MSAPGPRLGLRLPRRSADRDDQVPIGEVGQEPDPRFTFANERTFLAWNRTALALIAGGLAAADLLDLGFEAARFIVATSLIGLGAVLGLSSYRRWERNERCLRLGRPLPYSRLPRAFATGVGAIAILAGILVGVALLTR